MNPPEEGPPGGGSRRVGTFSPGTLIRSGTSPGVNFHAGRYISPPGSRNFGLGIGSSRRRKGGQRGG